MLSYILMAMGRIDPIAKKIFAHSETKQNGGFPL